MSCYIANLTTQSAAAGWDTSCTDATTSGFGFSQRGMTLNYAGNPNAASTPRWQKIRDLPAHHPAIDPLSGFGSRLRSEPHQYMCTVTVITKASLSWFDAAAPSRLVETARRMGW
jgi:hypothetical protein